MIPALNVQALALSHVQIRLRWNAINAADWYLLSRKKVGVSNAIGIVLLDAEATGYSDVDLEPESEYSYQVQAATAE